MRSTTFEILYQHDHRHKETWEEAGCYCPNCGEKRVWECAGEGDYYIGAQSICVACNCSFYLSNGPRPLVLTEQESLQRLGHLLAAEKT